MAVPLIYPALIPQPFALNGAKNTIPTLPDATPGHASLELGFPPLTMTPIELGGVPPSGQDMNGIINLLSQHTAWAAAGGQYKFDATLAAYIGGYDIGAVLLSNDGLSSYISLTSGNLVDFNTSPSSVGTLWGVYGGAAAQTGTATVSATGGTTTLTNQQVSAKLIFVTGALVADAIIQFPTGVVGEWYIVNNTAGAFTVSFKINGSPAARIMRQVSANKMSSDGVTLRFSVEDCVTRPANDSTTAVANTEFVTIAVSSISAGQVLDDFLYFQGQN